MPILTTLSAASSLFGLNHGLQIDALERLASSVRRKDDAAAAKLAEALGEIDKMLTALDAELVRYLALRFTPPDIPRNDLLTLLHLEAGQAMVRIEEARGHCSLIEVIYQVHLKRWIDSVLDPDGARSIESIFGAMHDADLSVIHMAGQVDAFLREHAEETLNHLFADDFPSANLLVTQARAEALPFRRDIFAELATLRRFEGAFLRAAKVV